MDIHPYWDTTEQKTNSVTAPTVEGTSVPIHTPARSPVIANGIGRQIAAAVGIIVVVSIGLWQTDSWQTLGQLLPDGSAQNSSAPFVAQGPAQSATVTLSNQGASPSTVSVMAGGSISFVNTSDIPYVLEAIGLLGAEGGAATVPFVFPGSTETFHVAAKQPTGTYTFTSATDATLSLSLTVLPASAGQTSSASSSSRAAVMEVPSIPAQEEVLPQAVTTPSSAAASTDLPRNPYTVDSPYQHPFDAQGNPIPELFNEDGTIKTSSSSRHAAATVTQHHPLTNTNSGPAVGVVVVLSTAVLWWRTSDRRKG